MQNTFTNKSFAGLLLGSAALLSVPFGSAVAEEDFVQAFQDGKVIADVRLRYEGVDQQGFSDDASAKTVRGRLGYETGKYYGFSALGEFDATQHLGSENFNSNVNGNTQYPVVADPDSYRLNRLNLNYTGFDDTGIKVGRQRTILDDARFVGNVGWRQNEQTFDALRFTNNSIDKLKFDYSYIWQVNGILGREATLGDFDSDSHLVDVTYSGFDFLSVQAFGHWLDFEEAKSASSLSTYGLRVKGNVDATESVNIFYGASYALQDDYANNTTNVDADYFSLDGGVKWKGLTGKLGYDVFEGDGTSSFQTPLATGHKFQGFADVFLTTPADGLENMHATVSYKTDGFSVFDKGLTLTGVYHDFEAENTSQDMGSEVDAVIAAPFMDNYVATIKYADYDGSNFTSDRKKVWLSFDFKY